MPRLTVPSDENVPEVVRPLLDATGKRLGFVPNGHRGLAISPKVLNSFTALQNSLGTLFDAATRHGIAHAVTSVNGCNYCNSMHTYVSRVVAGTDDDEVALNREGRSSNPKRDAAIGFAKRVVETRGKVDDADLDRVRDAGYSDPQILEIVSLAVQFTMTNYLNNVMGTEVDPATQDALSRGA